MISWFIFVMFIITITIIIFFEFHAKTKKVKCYNQVTRMFNKVRNDTIVRVA